MGAAPRHRKSYEVPRPRDGLFRTFSCPTLRLGFEADFSFFFLSDMIDSSLKSCPGTFCSTSEIRIYPFFVTQAPGLGSDSACTTLVSIITNAARYLAFSRFVGRILSWFLRQRLGFDQRLDVRSFQQRQEIQIGSEFGNVFETRSQRVRRQAAACSRSISRTLCPAGESGFRPYPMTSARMASLAARSTISDSGPFLPESDTIGLSLVRTFCITTFLEQSGSAPVCLGQILTWLLAVFRSLQ